MYLANIELTFLQNYNILMFGQMTNFNLYFTDTFLPGQEATVGNIFGDLKYDTANNFKRIYNYS